MGIKYMIIHISEWLVGPLNVFLILYNTDTILKHLWVGDHSRMLLYGLQM